MRQKTSHKFPFVGIGLLLIVISVAPTSVDMIRNFNQLQNGENTTAVSSRIEFSFHPAMIACCNVGLLLVIIGIIRAFRSSRTTVA